MTKKGITGYDIVYLSLFRWDNEYGSVPYYLSKKLAKSNRIFFVNQPLTWRDILSKPSCWKLSYLINLFKGRVSEIKTYSHPIIIIDPPIAISINWLTPGRLYNLSFQFNRRRIQNYSRRIFKKFSLREHIYLNCISPYYLDADPNCYIRIYQSIDELSQVPYSAKHGLRHEKVNMDQADLILVTSKSLIRSEYAKKTKILNNAVDFEYFSQFNQQIIPPPKLIKSLGQKIIGYIGNLDIQRIDFHLLEKIALANKDKILLLIGPINSQKAIKLNGKGIPNLLFGGPVHPDQVPVYLSHMDCVLIPFLCNIQTAKIYPLKINEYLSLGKPIVATKFSTDIESFKDVIFLAENHNEFLTSINEALNDPKDRSKMIQIAQSNSWTNRIRQLDRIIHQFQKNPRL